jgi:hypothetical protein
LAQESEANVPIKWTHSLHLGLLRWRTRLRIGNGGEILTQNQADRGWLAGFRESRETTMANDNKEMSIVVPQSTTLKDAERALILQALETAGWIIEFPFF